MLDIERGEEGQIKLRGRFDASQAAKATEAFSQLDGPTVIDMSGLSYISSLGLGVLLQTQKRLREGGSEGLKLVKISKHIHDIFRFSGFHAIFEIEEPTD
jgi:anti-anti-sigma factor